jgi:GAF domain-containing protein
VYLTEGSVLRHLASKGPSPDEVAHIDTVPINRESLASRSLLDGKTIQVPDILAEERTFPASYAIARHLGHRTVVATPLFREGHPFGVILLRREEVRPFTEREIALLGPFGDQAAIALENVRLFNETKEAPTSSALRSRCSPRSRTPSPIRRRFSTEAWQVASASSRAR